MVVAVGISSKVVEEAFGSEGQSSIRKELLFSENKREQYDSTFSLFIVLPYPKRVFLWVLHYCIVS
jgi:hypothetical protein